MNFQGIQEEISATSCHTRKLPIQQLSMFQVFFFVLSSKILLSCIMYWHNGQWCIVWMCSLQRKCAVCIGGRNQDLCPRQREKPLCPTKQTQLSHIPGIQWWKARALPAVLFMTHHAKQGCVNVFSIAHFGDDLHPKQMFSHEASKLPQWSQH